MPTQLPMTEEIRRMNLSYLMLAQRLIRSDRTQAMFRLGLSEEATHLLGMLSTAQMMRLAGSDELICHMRIDDNLVWSLLTQHDTHTSGHVASLHANILMAGRHDEIANRHPEAKHISTAVQN
jgi:flagellar transcriptional activator FlhD